MSEETAKAQSPAARVALGLVRTYRWIEGEYLAQPWTHHGIVHRLRVSPDGTRILSASFDNTARLSDPDRNAPVVPAFEHEATVHSVAWSADGSHRLSIHSD